MLILCESEILWFGHTVSIVSAEAMSQNVSY